MKTIQAVLFDLDGVVIDSEHLHAKAWEVIAQKYDVSGLTYDYYAKSCFGVSDHDIALQFFDKKDVPERVKEKIVYYLDHLQDIDVSRCIRKFISERPKHIKAVGIVTNCTRKEAERILAVTGLAPYIDVLVSCSDVPRPKPHPDPYRHALDWVAEHKHIRPENVLVIEDSGVGADAAKQAGVGTVLQKPFCDPLVEQTLMSLCEQSNLD